MSGYGIRDMEIEEFRIIFKLIREDFEEGEYAPYEVLKSQLKEGVQEGLILQQDGQAVAYAVCAEGHENNYVLISLLAVYKEFRKNGIGSAFIEEIQKRYQNKDGIIVEVEKPEEALNDQGEQERIKRISFYKRAGFYQIPDIDYSIWDVPMHLMVFPRKATVMSINRDIGQIIKQIYLQLMGEHYIHKLKFSSLQT
jgi:GNAT superfamily N-acetyltransferase